jgi:hypothetical protein
MVDKTEEAYTGKTLSIKKENGEEIKFRPLDGEKISDQTRQDMINSIENKDWDTFCRKVFETLTGQTVEEAKN